jgi:hypothetical protein
MGLNGLLLHQGVSDPFRKAATILSLVFVLGLVALIWAPETKGKPLPEQEEAESPRGPQLTPAGSSRLG